MAANNKYHFRVLTAQGQWVNENLEVVNPYLISLSKQKSFCFRCHTRTAFRPTLDPNVAEEYCPSCGASQAFHEAPADMRVPKDIGNYALIDTCLPEVTGPITVDLTPAATPNAKSRLELIK